MYWKQNDSTDIAEIEALHGGEGTVKAKHFFEGITRLPVRFLVWELAPGATWGRHSHEETQPQEEVLYCLDGQGTVWVDGEEVAMGPGDAVLLPQGSVHGFENVGDGVLKLALILGEPQP